MTPRAKLTGMQAQVLGLIADQGNQSVSDVAMHLRLSSASARGCIDRLEQRGLLARTYTVGTSHAFLVFATPAGEAVSRIHFGDGCYECDGHGVLDGLEPCPGDCEKSRQVMEGLHGSRVGGSNE